MTSAFEIGSTGAYVVFVVPNPPLAAGSYPLTVRYGSASAQGTVVVTGGGGGNRAASVGSSGTIRTRLTLGGSGSGGTPIEASFIATDGGVGLTGLSVVTTVTAPVGIVRQAPLADAGTAIDSGADDGAYGAYIYGTNAAGTYEVRVDATGTDRSGMPVSLLLTDTIDLVAMVDTDADGIADSLADQWGAGAADPDSDGASTAAELAAGSDPSVADADGGGEADGTEIAAGRNPLDPNDDLAVSPVGVAAVARDGRLVDVTVAAFDGTTPVHLYRVSAGTVTDLGLRPGAGEQFTDGPLPAGTYQYIVVGEAANGARTPPTISSLVEARDDAVPPNVAFYINNDDYATNDRSATITFIDLSEPVTEMRIAESDDALAAAAWTPYQTQTTFTLSPGDGVRQVAAQVRDASGLASRIASGFIVLDTTPPASSVGSLPATTSAPSIDIPYTASDELAGVSATELWVRWRASGSGTWSPWAVAATATTTLIMYGFAYGDGEYEFYSVAIDAAGNREAPPGTADARTIFGTADTTPPTSQAGPLNALYTSNSVSVPFSATDDRSGVGSVELWVRYRVNEARAWGAWSKALTGTSSPFSYMFANGDGNYEFYTIAIDSAGNREAAPATADAVTRRDAGNDPPDASVSLYASRPATCPPGQVCTNSLNVVTLTGTGTGVDDRSTVSVSWRLYGVTSNGKRTRLTNFTSAVPTDGAFDSRIEAFSISDQRADQGYSFYDVEIKISTETSTTLTYRVAILTGCDAANPCS